MKKITILIASVFLFFININYNLFNIISEEKFSYSENEISEKLIIGRLLNVEKNGFFSDGMFTGYPKTQLPKKKEYKWIKDTYLTNATYSEREYKTYNSQNGGQGILYSIFDSIFELDNNMNFKIFRAFNALLLSLAISLFVYWCYKKFSFIVATVVFLLSFFSPWLLMYGRSTWWCEWNFLLPFSILLLIFEWRLSWKNYYIGFSILLFVKLWFNGFEFITTYLVSASIPFVLYQFNRIKKWRFIAKSLIHHLLSVLSSVFLYFIILLFQFRSLKGSFFSGIDHVINALERRSHTPYRYEGQSSLLDFLQKLRLDVFFRYLGNNAFDLGFLKTKVPFIVIIGLGIVLSMVLLRKNKKLTSIVVVGNFSILAPASWFIIFNEHSHAHTHINFMIWYFPYLLFTFLFIGIFTNFVIHRKSYHQFISSIKDS